MPSSDWKNIEISMPPGILEAAGAITEITGVVSQFLQIVKGLAETVLELLPPELDIRAAAITAIVEAVEGALDDLFADNGAYILVVPIAKPVPDAFKKYLPDTSLIDRQSNILSNQRFPAEGAPNEVGLVPQEEGYTRSVVNLAKDQAIAAYIQAVETNVGGNPGFVRTVIGALDDQLDANRPQFDNATDHILAGILLMGADDAVNLIPDVKRLTNLFKILPPGVGERASLPLPQGVRTVVQIADAAETAPVTVFWDIPGLTQPETSILANANIEVARYAIIKSTNSDILASDDVVDLFGTASISTGTAARGHKVIFEGENNGKISYLDEEGIEFGVRTYYAVAFQYEIDGVSQPYSGISTVRTALYYPTLPPTRGVPPDWIRTPSFIAAIPPLNDLISLLKAKFAQLKNFGVSASGALEQYVGFLESEVERYTALAEEIDAIVTSVIEAFTPPEAGIYFKTIETSGGNNGFVFELLDSFSDTSDEGRPPFDEGDEAVFGIVFLAGASSQEKLAGLKTMFTLLFGAPSGSTGPLQDALAEIEDLATTLGV